MADPTSNSWNCCSLMIICTRVCSSIPKNCRYSQSTPPSMKPNELAGLTRDETLDAAAPNNGLHHADQLRGVAVAIEEPLRRPHVGLIENDMDRLAGGDAIERREEREHKATFRGLGADRAQIQDA